MRIDGNPDTRLLEQRSRLEFHYPKEDIIVFVPFYENPQISESKAANLVEYNPLGRTSSLFAYTGAKSRKLKVDLKFTLPHLERFDMGPEKFRRIISADSKVDQRSLFTKWSKAGDYEFTPPSPSLEAEKRYWGLRLDATGQQRVVDTTRKRQKKYGVSTQINPTQAVPYMKGPLERALTEGISGSVQSDTDRFIAENLKDPSYKHKAMDTLIFFTNIFRTCVDNDASNPLYGPPLLRLVHGTMYQSIPCVCRSVNIGFDTDTWGYDLETLTPRHVNISLDLAEVRVGDFGRYEPATLVKRDNLAGWESVINKPLTIDPGQLK
tara:strand:+ start:3873 stop:4841 length:969 start_codon:yes stop_codon:yes gene_type:complete